MLPNKLVQMLVDASGDPEYIANGADIELARMAEMWMLANDWDEHYRLGLVSGEVAITADPDDQALIVRTKIHGQWEPEGTVIPQISFAMALASLVSLANLPPHFSPHCRVTLNTLADHFIESAKVAERLKANNGGSYPAELLDQGFEDTRAAGFRTAAESTRYYAKGGR